MNTFPVSPVNKSLVGLAITQILALIGILQFGFQQIAEVINQLTNVERVLQYSNIETEGPFDTPEGKTLTYDKSLADIRKVIIFP